MTRHSRRRCRLLGALLATAVAAPAFAQSSGETPPPKPGEAQTAPSYKPPLRGAPGGRVGGASRSASAPQTPLPVIELLAPAEHAGITTQSEPTLYFYVSAPVAWPMQLTISAPLQPDPIVEAALPSPQAAGLHAARLSDYRVRLQPGVAYTWSVSIVLDPRAWSRNIVASATLVYEPSQAAALPSATLPASAAPEQRVADLAQAGLWYDAVGAALALPPRADPTILDPLLRQVGLTAAPGHRRAAIGP